MPFHEPEVRRHLALLALRTDLLTRADEIDRACAAGAGARGDYVVRTAPGLYLGLLSRGMPRPYATDVLHAVRLPEHIAHQIAPQVQDGLGRPGVAVSLADAMVEDRLKLLTLAQRAAAEACHGA